MFLSWTMTPIFVTPCGLLLEVAGFKVRNYTSPRQFLDDDYPKHGCLIADIRMPDMSGLELQEEVARRHSISPSSS